MRIVIVIIFLFTAFSQELISIGEPILKDPIPTINGLYLNDIAYILPILTYWASEKKLKIDLFLKIVLIIFGYGFINYLIHKSEASNIGIEIRIYLSLLTGYYLILMLKNNTEIKIGLSIIIYFCILNIIINFLKLPNLYAYESIRIGSEGIYNLIGPILIIGPSIIIITKKDFNGLILKLVYLLLLTFSIVLLKTRSLTFIILFSLIMIWLINIKLNNKTIKIGYLIIIVLTFIFTTKLFDVEFLEIFISRLNSAKDPSNDTNIQFRILEVITILESNSGLKLLFGSGLAPKAILFAENGNQYNISHIGIANIFWRFGILPTFIFFIFLITKLLNNFKLHFRNTLIILPSFLSYFISSISSGGYGTISFFCLGILIGLHKKFISST